MIKHAPIVFFRGIRNYMKSNYDSVNTLCNSGSIDNKMVWEDMLEGEKVRSLKSFKGAFMNEMDDSS